VSVAKAADRKKKKTKKEEEKGKKRERLSTHSPWSSDVFEPHPAQPRKGEGKGFKPPSVTKTLERVGKKEGEKKRRFRVCALR